MWRVVVGIAGFVLFVPLIAAADCRTLLLQRPLSSNPLLDSRQLIAGDLPNISKVQPIQYVSALDLLERQLQSMLHHLISSAGTTFTDILVPLEWQLSEIDRIFGFWQWQTSSNRIPAILKMEKIIEKRRVRIWDRIFANQKLFTKITVIYKNRDSLEPDQKRLVEHYYQLFIDNGLALPPEKQERLLQVRTELSKLRIQFNTQLIQSRGSFKLMVGDRSDLAGLSAETLDNLQRLAQAQGYEGYLLTLAPAIYNEVMAYCKSSRIREAMFAGMRNVAAEGSEFDNVDVIKRLIQLRTEQAQLLGYASYADWILRRRMVGSLANLRAFYDELLAETRPRALAEEKEFQAFVQAQFGQQNINPWDREYYQRRFIAQSLQLDAQKIKQHFTLQRSLDVLFALIHRLYNITLVVRSDLPAPHQDASVIEVRNRDGRTLSFVYFYPFSRDGLKSAGAWMSTISTQNPSLITIHLNLQKPTDDAPTLMSPDDVVTLFHEFGHGLHGILSRARYHSQFGTKVVRDAVELPSQLLERYVFVPSVLGELAYHAQTGEHLGADDMAKIIRERQFRSAIKSMRQIRFGLLDMAWHSGEIPLPNESLRDYEIRILKDVNLYEESDGLLISPTFSHIFYGGYASGYYTYKWSDRLVDKVMTRFEKEGLFNPETAADFESYVLAVGDGMDPQLAVDLFLNH